mgnify:CR=1 FL=1
MFEGIIDYNIESERSITIIGEAMTVYAVRSKGKGSALKRITRGDGEKSPGQTMGLPSLG